MAAPDNNNNNNNDYDNPTAEAMLVTIRRDEEEINPNNEARGRDQEDQKPNPKPKIKFSLKSIKIRQRFIMLPIALLTFILSIPFLFEAMWLFFVQQFDCEGLLESLPRLQVGSAVAANGQRCAIANPDEYNFGKNITYYIYLIFYTCSYKNLIPIYLI